MASSSEMVMLLWRDLHSQCLSTIYDHGRLIATLYYASSK